MDPGSRSLRSLARDDIVAKPEQVRLRH